MLIKIFRNSIQKEELDVSKFRIATDKEREKFDKILYKDAYGKKVKVKEGLEKVFDGFGNEIDKSKVYLVTYYIDSEDGIVGIYPLEDGGFTESELLSVQYKKHEVFCDQLEYV